MSNNKRNKIGILGGNFNPIHFAHLMLADQARQSLHLDKVWLMPEYLPPHIDEKATIEADHRVKMLALAIQDNPSFQLELGEIEREGKSYTFETMKILTKKYPDTDFYFIIGSDMVEYLPKWYKIDELIQMVHFVAFKRENKATKSPYPVIWIEAPVFPLSSTGIREMIKNGNEPNYLLPKEVLDYIKKNQLYL
ncbi:nicotinate-nucleotide adenylyltransferase [Lactococcus fujiensis]|uniref:Probable nicotinate-nucleotide adenylyltransferase n=1 Tax=Lactococcus fujiensis JCM 16395 TaxID=1291764 RepID=A0A2A5RK22_9LACT|nr:nicotinate-nucleotide adenylyltransferase [Lactococcus fujiensis]PCR99512.1 nicotinic acid mononucleotide adenylyltransferase [Lactococcus fujiensis JCM 16395]